jgi:hypothetical protein
MTNFYRHFGQYYTVPTVVPQLTNSSYVTLVAMPNNVLNASLFGNWGYITLHTNIAGTNQWPLVLPLEYSGSPNFQTAMASNLTRALNMSPRAIDVAINAMSNYFDRHTSQIGGNKGFTNSWFSNSVYWGSVGLLSGGVISGTHLSNTVMKSSSITDSTRLAVVSMSESDFLALNGSGGTNYWVVQENGSMYMVSSVGTMLAYTNSVPGLGEIVNYGTMLTLFPIRQHNFTNHWGSANNWTNAAGKLVFWYGFTATNPVTHGGVFTHMTNRFGLTSSGTNFSTGSEFAGEAGILLLGLGSKIGGPGIGHGDTVVGAGNSAYVDGQGAVLVIGRNNIITNDGKGAIGHGLVISNSGAFGFLGQPTEAGEFKIGGDTDGVGGHTFIRFGVPVRDLTADGRTTLSGDLAYTPLIISSAANGNNTLQPLTNVYLRVTGTVSTNFTVTGLVGGRAGREIMIENDTAWTMILANQSGAETAETNRIDSPTSADIHLPTKGVAKLVYKSTQRWKVEHAFPVNPVSMGRMDIAMFGDGQDGNVDFDGSTTVLGMAPVSSTYVVNRSLNLSNVLIRAGVTLVSTNFRVMANGTLTNLGTIKCSGNAGTAGSGSSGGTAGVALNAAEYGASGAGGNGAGGATGAGAAGSTGGGLSASMGVAGGQGGNSGLGTSGAGASGGAGGTITSIRKIRALTHHFLAGATVISSSTGGGGGAGGGGNGAQSGGGGGAGGSGGGFVIIWADKIINSGTITAAGGAGGNGANGTGSNCGGGGGGAGGGGGVVFLVYNEIDNTGTITAAGGAGGTKGLSGGAGGADGTDGAAGTAGSVMKYNGLLRRWE